MIETSLFAADLLLVLALAPQFVDLWLGLRCQFFWGRMIVSHF